MSGKPPIRVVTTPVDVMSALVEAEARVNGRAPSRRRQPGPVESGGVPELTDDVTGGRDPLLLASGPECIRVLAGAVDAQIIPDTFVQEGRPTHVTEVSGSLGAQHGGDDAGLPKAAVELRGPLLAKLLAEHTFTYRIRRSRDDEEKIKIEEFTPPQQTLTAALEGRHWPGLPPLRGIVGAPTLRPDGTLLQREGYDAATGFYLAPRVNLGSIPDRPTTADVTAAKDFLLGTLLRDFPWVEPADRANYLALMLTPLLRPFLRALVPFGIVTATMPGSGKTILTSGIGLLVGQRVLSWTHSEEELRKAITSVLLDQCGVIVFDNLHEGAVIDSAVLARLITDPRWSDRGLGGNKVITIPNDRLWLATGNALSVGGDMASRSVLVRLDPNMPNPDKRTGFAIESLDSWILDSSNQRTVLRHLLVLILDWTAAGAPPSSAVPAMRQFTRWAQMLGGLLGHHGVPAFLANVDAAREVDEHEAEWVAFFVSWRRLYGESWVSAADLRKSAEPQFSGLGTPASDPWGGAYFTDVKGNPISGKALGRRLQANRGRFRGQFRLEHRRNTVTNSNEYRVEVRSA